MSVASNKIKKFKRSVKDYKQHMRAGICPTCKEGLQLKSEERVYYTTMNWFWIYKQVIPHTHTMHTVVCPNKHDLIHPVHGKRESLGCTEFKNCVNKEIRDMYSSKYDNDYDDYGYGY